MTLPLAVEAMRLGAYDYVVKNLDNSHLLLLPGVIRRALEKRELERERVRTVEALRVQNRNLAFLNRVSQTVRHLTRRQRDHTPPGGVDLRVYRHGRQQRLAAQ